MLNVAQLAESAATMTSLVDIAAAVETRLHDAETRNHDLQRELQQARQREDQARR